ncbi:hypothetical protein [Kitasatospora sp. NPDC057223]|uniref:hypothetical protein n=1 Tax=Kitasatospora sp. NPDC057223 TaxID=3346055 RepID=UPI003631ADE1
MAEPHSNARSRAQRGAPTSGVIHIRTRLTANFTVLSNKLLQRPGSAVTVGVAAYVLSLPDGAIVSIAALCAHFTEGEILISRALRELEQDGFLQRRRERTACGRIRTRTYAYDLPGTAVPAPAPSAPMPPTPPTPPAQQAQQAPPAAPAAPRPTPPPSQSIADADPQAVVILASLRILDRRLLLSEPDIAGLAPAVAAWLARGVGPAQITEHLTADLPERFRSRPARLLAFRLLDPPVAAPAALPGRAAAVPWQTCDGGCERAFRSTEPGRCRDCAPDARAA